MKAYLAIKFHADGKNRQTIEAITESLKKINMHCTNFFRDIENWGQKHFEPKELMRLAFEETRKADFLIIEFSEKGVGLGIEAGFAAANKIPILVLAKTGSDISSTLQGIATAIVFYDDPSTVHTNIDPKIFTQ